MAASRPSLPIPVGPAWHAVCEAHITPGPFTPATAQVQCPPLLRRYGNCTSAVAPGATLHAACSRQAPCRHFVPSRCLLVARRVPLRLPTHYAPVTVRACARTAPSAPFAPSGSRFAHTNLPRDVPVLHFLRSFFTTKTQHRNIAPSNSATQIVRDPLSAHRREAFRSYLTARDPPGLRSGSRTTCSAPLPPFRSPTRNAQKECSRMLPSAVPNATFSSTLRTQHFERLPRSCTPQQREEGLSRSVLRTHRSP